MDKLEQLNVLLIDDDDSIRELLAEVISREGHQVISALSAEEGLSYLPSWTFQLAFLDHRLPGMQGLMLGEYLRRNNPNMTIALITGDHDAKLVKRSRDSSITYLRKPFDLNDVLQIVDETLAGASTRLTRRQLRSDGDFAPPFSRFAADLATPYAIRSVPARLETRLVQTVKDSLYNLRSTSQYNERDRVVALAGLLAARVLDVDLPRNAEGKSLYEEYDRLMERQGRRTEFASN